VENVDAETAEPRFRDREIDLEIARELLEFTGMILPSILIMTGENVVKNKSDAFLSTINLNSGLTFMAEGQRAGR
jgi:hypothetical protein